MTALFTGPVPALRIYYGDTSWIIPVAIVALVVFGVLWIMARAREARDREARRRAAADGHDVGAFQQDHTAEVVVPSVAAASSESPRSDERGAAWAALFDPETSPESLADIAARHPEFAPQIAVHPQAYPSLRAWAESTKENT